MLPLICLCTDSEVNKLLFWGLSLYYSAFNLFTINTHLKILNIHNFLFHNIYFTWFILHYIHTYINSQHLLFICFFNNRPPSKSVETGVGKNSPPKKAPTMSYTIPKPHTWPSISKKRTVWCSILLK